MTSRADRLFEAFETMVDPFDDVPGPDAQSRAGEGRAGKGRAGNGRAGEGRAGRGEAGAPPATLGAYLAQQLAPWRRWLPLMVAVGLVVALVETFLIFYAGRLVDLMTATGPAGFWSAHGLEVTGVALFIVLARPCLIGLNHLLLDQGLASNLQERARWQAHRHLLGHAPSFFQRDFAGRISNRVLQIGPAIEDSVFLTLEGMWFAVAYVAGAVLILSDIDWRLGLPLVIWVGLYALYVRHMAVRVAVASEAWSDARSEVSGRVVDAYANVETVKLFASGASEEAYALASMRRLQRAFQGFRRLMTELSFGMNLLNGLLIVAVVGPAVWLWMAGTVSLGQVAATTALTIRLNGMSGWIMNLTTRLFEHMGVIREALRSVSVPHEVNDLPAAPALEVRAGEIRIDAVRHHYGQGRGGLNGISLTIPAGQRVGLVGRSGAGKSSLVKLLLRFHDAEAGRIEIDGQDITAVTQDSLRAQIGVVSQDSSLLHRSIRENILYGRPEATEEEMIAAARRAHAHDFIQGLVDSEGRVGYDAQVGERGVKLSGGQRQRISMARVLLKDAPILILDEATSALDSEVEAAIQETLYGVMQGKTVIAIAHRLSTIAQMDRIVVLDDGRIVEDGTHAELLARNGLYARFWERQSGGFIGLEETA